MRTTPSLVSAVFVQFAASTCTRKGISTALDNFFLVAITKQPLFTAPEVKISSNGYPQTSLQSTPYANITWLERPDFKVQALDVPACQGARYTVTRQKNQHRRRGTSTRLSAPRSFRQRRAHHGTRNPEYQELISLFLPAGQIRR